MPAKNETFSWRFYLLIVVVLGALLGLAEAALGFLRTAGLPRSPFVTAAGFALMALGLAVYKKAGVIPGIALMGVLGKWLAVPILGLPLFCQANAHLAILLNGAFLFAGVRAFRGPFTAGWKQRGALAGVAAFTAGGVFFALGRFVAPCAHLLSFHYAGGAVRYMLTRVAPAAALAALAFPLGYALGRRLERRLLPLGLARRPLLATLAGGVALACWGLAVWLTGAAANRF